jgi:uncharacterized membrane protein
MKKVINIIVGIIAVVAQVASMYMDTLIRSNAVYDYHVMIRMFGAVTSCQVISIVCTLFLIFTLCKGPNSNKVLTEENK